MNSVIDQLEQNKAVIQELFSNWSAGDIPATCRLVSPECNGGGAEGLRRELEAFLTVFPDLQITLEDMLAEDEKVATRVTMRGTHQGPLFGVPATGKSVVMKANHIFKLKHGLIVQRHGQMDRLELMQQLGVMPIPSGENP